MDLPPAATLSDRVRTFLAGRLYPVLGTSGPDGLAIDDEDNVVVCHNGFGAVWMFSAVVGEPKLRINSSCGIYTTNCAFGGTDNKTLFITESRSGSILKADLPVSGRKLYSRTI